MDFNDNLLIKYASEAELKKVSTYFYYEKCIDILPMLSIYVT